MLRVALELSITRFVRTGLGVYATQLSKALRQMNVEIIPCSIPHWMGNTGNALTQKLSAAYWQIVYSHIILPKYLRHFHCDLIHYTTATPISKSLPCPAVTTIHDLIPVIYPEWVPPVRGNRMRNSIHSALERSQHIVTDSEATRQDVLSHFYIDPSRVTTIYLGQGIQFPNLDYYSAQQIIESQYKLLPGYVLCVGSLEPRKNIERVVEAYSSLRRSQLCLPPLVIVGGATWKHERLYNVIKTQQITNDVMLLGHVSNLNLAALLRCAGVFVYPSLYEGFGLPPLEAMQCSCPVVTSSVSSLPEIVGDAAIKVDPLSVQELANAILAILSDPRLAQQLREQGQEQVRKFSWTKCAEETVAIYHRNRG
jgi:glycosyltransferase involved in cell wall biosynthesis